MRSVKIGLAFAMLAALPVIWVAGCTADGGAGGEETDSGTTSSGDNGGSSSGIAVPDSSTDPVDARADTGKPDAKADSALDAAKEAEAGPKAPEPGDACTSPGTVFQRACGACGTQEAVCEANNKVSDYSFCAGEVAGGCTPGATRSAPCGKCGTRNEVCQNNCTWAVGACGGEPPQACTPLEEKYITAGCSAPSTFRKQVCQNNCQYGPPSPLPCFDFPPDVTIAGAVDGEVTYDGNLTPLTDRIARVASGTCPSTLSTTLTSYSYLVVKNPTAQTAKVEIYYTAPAGGANIDTITGVYNVPPPKTDAERQACVGKVNDFCSTAPCTTSWSGLVGADAPSIAPGASIVVYTAAYFATDTGPFVLHVKTKSLL
jgi:hypothetical protein